jgi:YD repeat-containing protein
MATPAVTPQAATAWDEQGNPVQAQQPAATGATAWDEQGNPVSQAAPQQQDSDSDEIPETSYGAATWGAVKNLGKDTLSAVKGAANMLNPKPQDPSETEALKVAGIGGMLIHRMVSGMGHDAIQAEEIPAAIHDINQSPDPMGTYAKVIQKTASQGAGQAMTALATEGAVKGAGAVGDVAEGAKGLAKDVVKGKNVGQEGAQASLREAAGSDGGGSLRESLSDPINEGETAAKDLYRQIDQASGADLKSLGEKLQTVNRAMRQSVSEAEDTALETRREQILDRMKEAKQTAIEKGVDPNILNQADEQFKRTSAMTDVEKKVFKNPDIVKGNAAHGTEESIDIDKAVKALQKLQDSEKYGGPRLEQAFGKEGATKLLDKFYGAQRQGVHAMKVQKVAKWVAGVAGAGAVAKTVSTLSGGKGEN